MKPLFHSPKRTALEAQYEAQKIAYAPVVFQAVRAMRELGILQELHRAGEQGIDAPGIAEATGLSRYGVETLLETGLSCAVVAQNDAGMFVLTKTGWFLLHDEMTRINMDYNHYVCYKGLYELDESIKAEKPLGLRSLGGEWQTLYQALPHLPERISESWYAFDHFYSDAAYPVVLPLVLRGHPRSLIDIGTNVGKFAIQAANWDPALRITMLDLPDQLGNARRNVIRAGLDDRIDALAMDLLDPDAAIPGGFDVYWLSQLLSCFGEQEIVSILRRVAAAMPADALLFILETCWDRQQHEAAAYALVNTSPYFTCIASGNSKMYSGVSLQRHIRAAGLRVERIHDHLGICHTLFECRRG